MPDFIHMDNIIQGAVLQITERRPLEQQEGALEALYQFLKDQQTKVLLAKIRVQERCAEAPPEEDADEP